MNRPSAAAAVICLLLLAGTSCKKREHFISDPDYRRKVEAQFKIQKDLAGNREKELFGVFRQDLTTSEKEALYFLYAYMPISDLADYDGEFYLKNVRASFAARDTFSWGRTVPEEIFRHFVVPIRINNENLDSSRLVFFAELKDRIRNLSMKDAALEVNHWCHEKVTYRGTDVRTSSPLATVKTAFGRCGEESTFTVAVMRSVGIPARQCYTPRWAHSDDNHAWVEVWIDGKWHYLGACEPEPDLDMAWFTSPAKRAMLVNTNVFGDYGGPEDVLVKDTRFTRINILSNYTDTKRIFVKVTGESGMPADSATVEFQLYNYAEFYPLTKCLTGETGLCSFLTGYGDLLVWAAKGDRFGFRKVSVRDADTILLPLTWKEGDLFALSFDLVPPPEIKTESPVSDSLRKINSERLEFENRVRSNYENTFIDSAKTYRLAGNLGLNADTLWHFLKLSRGNWREITGFISDLEQGKKQLVFPLLSVVSEKDLRDISPEALTDHILYSENPGFPEEIFHAYILNPRVDNEWVKPYKQYFRERCDTSLRHRALEDPRNLAGWIRSNVRTDPAANWGRAPLTPTGSYELRVADAHSRDILFVALCRSFGIPARLEPATRMPQFYRDAKWNDVTFVTEQEKEPGKSFVALNNDPQNDRVPEYFIHYTLERFSGGFFRSLDYETDPRLKKFPCTVEVPSGYYLFVTGNRVSGGIVLASLSSFIAEPGMIKDLNITLRRSLTPPAVLGRIGTAGLSAQDPRKACTLPGGKELILAWLEPDKEPTKHLLAEMKERKDIFSQWRGKICFFLPDEKTRAEFEQKHSGELPAGILYMTVPDNLLKQCCAAVGRKGSPSLPVVIYLESSGDILYFSEGYRIGLAGDLARLLRGD